MNQPKLLDQVRHRLRYKHYGLKTERAYTSWISRCILFHNKSHPKDLDGRAVARFLSNLAAENIVADHKSPLE